MMFKMIWAIGAFLFSFWLYAGVRTMAGGPLGGSLRGTCAGIVLIVLYFTPIIGAWFLICHRMRKSNRFLPVLRIAASAGMLACLCSEIWILADEIRFVNQSTFKIPPGSEQYAEYYKSFSKQAADKLPTDWGGRSRQWPLGGSLHYSPERGFWAND